VSLPTGQQALLRRKETHMHRCVPRARPGGLCRRSLISLAPLCAALGLLTVGTGTAAASGSCLNSSIASNFNGTAIPGGSYIWFNANFKVSGVSGKNVTIHFTNSTLKFSSGGTSYNIAVSNATIKFSTSATTATTERVGPFPGD